jgi:hypothetical protein
MKRVIRLIAICLYACSSALWADEKPVTKTDSAATTIAPGTVITMANWTQYRGFMSDGMATLFEGKYFWKMPPDIRIEVAPTDLHPLPRNYLAATEKYAPEVKIVELPDGGLTLKDYMGGIPFPNPQEPHKGWKVLVNLWFRYAPYLVVDRYAPGCSIDRAGNLSCERADLVNRQLSYNTDRGLFKHSGTNVDSSD